MSIEAHDAPHPEVRIVSRIALRFLISAVVAAGLGLAWWSSTPAKLTGHLDIVGYPTFTNFAFQRSFVAFRLIIWEFPIVTALVYTLLRWRGPLRAPAPSAQAGRPAPSQRIDLIEPTAESTDPTAERAQPATRWLQLAAPAVVVGFVVSALSPKLGDRVDGSGVGAAIAYVVIVAGLSMLITVLLRRRRSTRPWLRRLEADPLSFVNAVAITVVSAGSLVTVSARTMVISGKQRHNWPWFPVWLGVLMVAVVLAWITWRLVAGWEPAAVERRVRTVLLGAVAIFLLTAVLPGTIYQFTGFDDSQSVVGADLLSRGYFPWRDFIFIHGLFEDALRSSIGFGVFQHSVWGAAAGTALIVTPVCWVGYYLLSVWATRRGSLVVLAVFAMAAWGGVSISVRFVAEAFVFILLGEALRRPKPRWMVGFTAALFVEAVLVPEALFQVIAVVVVIIAADLVHRDPARPWWQALRRTRYFLSTGVVLSAAFAGFLALNHALTAFVDYYRIFGPGHDASGAIPPTQVTTIEYAMFAIAGVLVILTIATVTWRLLGRRSWSARDWVTMAAAILTGLYGEKALGRFDGSHVQQSVTVAVPLAILWTTAGMQRADSAVSALVTARLRRIRRLAPTRGWLRQPVAVLALVLIAALVPNVARTIWHSPGNTKHGVASLASGTAGGTAASSPLVGYDTPVTDNRRLLADLSTLLTTYAGSTGQVFDNTNGLGYIYYLLQRAPATAFVHVSMAQSEFAQGLLIDQLRKTRPPVVVFDNLDLFGLPSWDKVRNNVRHYQVAQYLLDGWTPIVRSDSVLLMLRNDLVANTPPVPTVPVLTAPPQTSELDYAVPVCDWGDAANFVDSLPAGTSLTLPVTSLGHVRRLDVSGWSFDPTTHLAPLRIVVTIGNSVVADVAPSVGRRDVAFRFGDPAGASSGFDVSVNSSAPNAAVHVYALARDGMLHPLGVPDPAAPTVMTIRMPDGSRLEVSTPVLGSSRITRSAVTLYEVAVPAATRLSSFQLATFTAASAFGTSRLELTDVPLPDIDLPAHQIVTGNVTHEIIAGVLPVSGSSLPVRVGSCLQWHGYATRTLYLLQTNGAPVTGVRLSGVRS